MDVHYNPFNRPTRFSVKGSDIIPLSWREHYEVETHDSKHTVTDRVPSMYYLSSPLLLLLFLKGEKRGGEGSRESGQFLCIKVYGLFLGDLTGF